MVLLAIWVINQRFFDSGSLYDAFVSHMMIKMYNSCLKILFI